MNRDVQLAIYSFCALIASLVVAGFVLGSDHDEVTAKESNVDRRLLQDTQEAEPLGQKGSNAAFHWLLERVIQGEL